MDGTNYPSTDLDLEVYNLLNVEDIQSRVHSLEVLRNVKKTQ